jgi:hypothetical protein
MFSQFIVVSLVLPLASVPRVLGKLECQLQRAAVPSDSGHALVTRDADEAQNTALCHVFCINSLFQSVSGNNSNTTSNNITVPVSGNTTIPVAMEV